MQAECGKRIRRAPSFAPEAEVAPAPVLQESNVAQATALRLVTPLVTGRRIRRVHMCVQVELALGLVLLVRNVAKEMVLKPVITLEIG